MVGLTVDARRIPAARTACFFWMSLAMAHMVLGPLAPVVRIHGVFHFAWVILLVAQCSLMRRLIDLAATDDVPYNAAIPGRKLAFG